MVLASLVAVTCSSINIIGPKVEGGEVGQNDLHWLKVSKLFLLVEVVVVREVIIVVLM